MTEQVRVFVGTDSSIHEKAEVALVESILSNITNGEETQLILDFIRPGWKSGCTGFTNHRFLIPSLCNYEGFAIYMDVDMIVLGDIAELWSYKTPGKWCTTGLRDDVSVIDCAAFKDLTPDFVRSKRKDAIRSKIGARCECNIPQTWNHIDKLGDNTKLLHYSDLDRQPWHPIPGHPYKPHPDPAAVELFWYFYKKGMGLL